MKRRSRTSHQLPSTPLPEHCSPLSRKGQIPCPYRGERSPDNKKLSTPFPLLSFMFRFLKNIPYHPHILGTRRDQSKFTLEKHIHSHGQIREKITGFQLIP